MKRIPVTREFDQRKPIGYLLLQDDIEITPDDALEWGYIVLEQTSDGRPTKIQVQEVGLVAMPVRRKQSDG